MRCEHTVLERLPAANVGSNALYVPSEYLIKHATERWEHREAARLRRSVFCTEQGLFEGSDADAIDRLAAWLQQGPPMARVDAVQRFASDEITDTQGFEVL